MNINNLAVKGKAPPANTVLSFNVAGVEAASVVFTLRGSAVKSRSGSARERPASRACIALRASREVRAILQRPWAKDAAQTWPICGAPEAHGVSLCGYECG